jgi:hypothetical protein
MKKPYCCDDSRNLYERYYDRQQKGEGEFLVYVGRYMQKGHGLGNILGSLFRRILPVLKSFAPHALRAGANVLQDVSQGKSWKESAIKRIPEGIRSFSVRLSENNPDPVNAGNVLHRRTYSTDGMAFIHEGSCECAKSELDLFSLPSMQTSIESGIYVEYHPISNITGGAPSNST